MPTMYVTEFLDNKLCPGGANDKANDMALTNVCVVGGRLTCNRCAVINGQGRAAILLCLQCM